jgi:hypothetical protein
MTREIPSYFLWLIIQYFTRYTLYKLLQVRLVWSRNLGYP